MKPNIITMLALAGFASAFAETLEVKGANGKTVSMDVKTVTHEHLVITLSKPGETANVPWAKVDMAWLEKYQPDLFKRYQIAVADFVKIKDFDPVPIMRENVAAFLAAMKNGESVTKTYVYERDEKGQLLSIKVVKGEAIAIGRTYNYLLRVVNTQPGKDIRSGIDLELLTLSTQASRLRAKLLELPNAKSNITAQKINDRLQIISEEVLKIRVQYSALDRTALGRIRESIEYLESL